MNTGNSNHTFKPSDFIIEPWDSIFKSKESEIIALNIMKILKRTGDTFRKISWEEYKEERLKDGNFTESEKVYFEKVVNFCATLEGTKLFSRTWHRRYMEIKHGTTFDENGIPII